MKYGIPSLYNIAFSVQPVSADFNQGGQAYSEIQMEIKCF